MIKGCTGSGGDIIIWSMMLSTLLTMYICPLMLTKQIKKWVRKGAIADYVCCYGVVLIILLEWFFMWLLVNICIF